MSRDRDGVSGAFYGTALLLAGTWAALRFGLPWLAVALGRSEVPVPTPAFALYVYMLCALVGALLFVSSDEDRWRSFAGPVVRLLVLPDGPGRRGRLAVLVILPLLAGWMVRDAVSPSTDVAATVRLQHPTMPARYAGLVDPIERPTAEERRDGLVAYQRSCRPCHGAAADGTGPLARGLRLRPVDFTDPGAIGSVVEAYPFWRVREGHAGLPDIATPWNSAMPAWGDELDDAEIWRIVDTEYGIAGIEPRRPEGAEAGADRNGAP